MKTLFRIACNKAPRNRGWNRNEDITRLATIFPFTQLTSSLIFSLVNFMTFTLVFLNVYFTPHTCSYLSVTIMFLNFCLYFDSSGTRWMNEKVHYQSTARHINVPHRQRTKKGLGNGCVSGV